MIVVDDLEEFLVLKWWESRVWRRDFIQNMISEKDFMKETGLGNNFGTIRVCVLPQQKA